MTHTRYDTYSFGSLINKLKMSYDGNVTEKFSPPKLGNPNNLRIILSKLELYKLLLNFTYPYLRKVWVEPRRKKGRMIEDQIAMTRL